MNLIGLTRIANGMTDCEMRKRRIIFVCTWKDTREHDEGYKDMLEEVKKMVFDAVGTDIPFFDVSIKKYLDGINKGKETRAISEWNYRIKDLC